MVDLNSFLFAALSPAKPFFDLALPSLYSRLPQLIVITISIVLYGFLIYRFYRFLAKRDVFGLDIKKYYEEHSGWKRIFHSTVLGIIKYGLFFPIVVFFWFAGFTVLFSFLAKNLPVDQLLLVCIAFVTAIRITSYYTEDLSRDLAKLIPLALLGISLAEPNFFSLSLLQERAASVGTLISDILAYFLFIILVEWVLRILLHFKYALFGVGKLAQSKESD